MKALLARFWANQSGATAIEYGLIAALIAVACLIAIATLGASVQGMATPTRIRRICSQAKRFFR